MFELSNVDWSVQDSLKNIGENFFGPINMYIRVPLRLDFLSPYLTKSLNLDTTLQLLCHS